MKGHIKTFLRKFFLLFVPILAVFLLVSSANNNSASALTEAQKKKYAQNNIVFIGDCLPGDSFATGGAPITGSEFPATPYSDITENQIRGLLALVDTENGGAMEAVRRTISIMPNLYEAYHPNSPRTAAGLVNYVRTTGWFKEPSLHRYNENHVPTMDGEIEAATQILKYGKRAIPTEVIEYDSIWDIKYIKVNGNTYTDDENLHKKKDNYIPGETLVMGPGGDEWVFYGWSNPEGNGMTEANEGGLGDAFGYMPSKPPSNISTATIAGNSSGGSSLDTSGNMNAMTDGSATNYKGDTILSSEEINKIKEFQPIYEEAVKGTELPWQVVASLHYRESHLSDSNPSSNNDGLFQIYGSGKYPAGKKLEKEEMVAQAKEAAQFFINKISNKYSLSSEEGIKYGFFAYNGTADGYKTQALSLGFNQQEAELGAGSPYVMNRYDEKRDPTVEPTKSNSSWCQIKKDGGPKECPANTDFGAFVVYTALTGGSWTSTGGTSNPIDTCEDTSTSGQGNGGESIAAKARELAWPDGSHHNELKPEFGTAIASAFGYDTRSYCAGKESHVDIAQDCGNFVATVVISSGADPDFPKGYTPNLEEYMSNSDKWQEIENLGNESNLQPGDVFVANAGSYGYGSKKAPSGGSGGSGHTFIYLGGEDKTASASLCNRTGNLGVEVRFEERYGKYRIFRSTVQSGITGGTVGSFDEELKKIETDTGHKVGAAVSATGNTDASQVQVGGSWTGGRAWSTIKVPLAIAAAQKNASTGQVTEPYGTSCNPGLSSAINLAITKSDNCAAWWLWEALGGDNSSAAQTVTDVIKSGGDSSTTVASTKGSKTGLTSGTTSWSLVGQAIFAANIASIKNSGEVMTQMKTHNAGDGSSGLNKYTSAMTKGGWGSTDGDGATRQLGVVKLGSGKCSAIAIGTNASSNFGILDRIVTAIKNHESDLPSGSCPGGL